MTIEANMYNRTMSLSLTETKSEGFKHSSSKTINRPVDMFFVNDLIESVTRQLNRIETMAGNDPAAILVMNSNPKVIRLNNHLQILKEFC